MTVGAGRNESLVEGGQQGIKMNFGAELADSNLTLIYASAAGCKFTRKFIPDWSREGTISLVIPNPCSGRYLQALNRNKWEFYDVRKRPTRSHRR